MKKKFASLSEEDLLLLKRARRAMVINFSVWFLSFLFVATCMILILSTSSYPGGEDMVLFLLLFSILALLPLAAVLYQLSRLKKINGTLEANKKIILEDITLPVINGVGNESRRYFVNDGTLYAFETLQIAGFVASFKRVSHLPPASHLLLHIAEPSHILLKYELVGGSDRHNPGYICKEEMMTEKDKKTLIRNATLLFRIVNFVILPACFIIFCFAAGWNKESIGRYIMPIWLAIGVAINLAVFIYYLILRKQSNNTTKIILSGNITDVVEQGRGKYYRLYIYLGMDAFSVSTGETGKDFFVGQPVSLHYVLRENGQRGSLIKIDRQQANSDSLPFSTTA